MTQFQTLAKNCYFTEGYAARIVFGGRVSHPSHKDDAARLIRSAEFKPQLKSQAAFILKLEARYPYQPSAGPRCPLP